MKYLAIVLAFAGVALTAPSAYAANMDCFHDAVEDPMACITAGIEDAIPQPHGTVVFRAKDCNYLVVKPEGADTYAFVHKEDGERPKFFARLFLSGSFTTSFKEGLSRNFKIDNGLDAVRLETVATGLDATQAAALFFDRCK